jgi:hypothetical protein
MVSPVEKITVRHGNKGGQLVGRFATLCATFISSVSELGKNYDSTQWPTPRATPTSKNNP